MHIQQLSPKTVSPQIGNDDFCDVLTKVGGPGAVDEWKLLQERMRPLSAAAALMPPVAFRQDLGVLVSAIFRYFPALLTGGGTALKLSGARPPKQHCFSAGRLLRNIMWWSLCPSY